MRSRQTRQFPIWLEIAALLAAAMTAIATSPAFPRQYPSWKPIQTESATFNASSFCVSMRVAKSGKSGFGVVLEVKNTENNPLPIEITAADLRITGKQEIIPACALPPKKTVLPGETIYLYLPFAFDNEAAWNQGFISANLLLSFRAGSAGTSAWEIQLKHVSEMDHRYPGIENNRRCAPSPVSNEALAP